MAPQMTSQPQNTETHPPSFSLKEIASWTPRVCQEVTTKIRASIPALQRGLVWSPQQNELLWDSILRGFPIGALVVTKWSDKLKKTDEVADDSITYHLLDGQQRCNAIAMGFSDPFTATTSSDEEKVESILWLDLNPKLEKNSTRNYWVRATTTAHPWGYSKNDSATPVSIGDIRKALKLLGLDAANPKYRRPSPIDLWPCEAAADTPAPLAWLMQLPTNDENAFWTLLGQKSADATPELKCKWADKVRKFCVNPDMAEKKDHIFRGIKNAHSASLIALEAPKELLEGSEREKLSSSDDEGVSNIEQLFQRLNQQGTKLDGEELAYSMIKAYWRDLEKPINDVSEGRMPQARMVSLGVRAALAREAKENLPGPPTVSALRLIARNETERKKIIEKFIKRDPLGDHDLHGACTLVDRWLKYDEVTNQSGLLPVQIASIAIGSRDVYLLLLYFAKQMSGMEVPGGWNKTMQGLATILHWFSADKSKVVNTVYALCRDEPNIGNIRMALKKASDAGNLHTIHTPKAVDAFDLLRDGDLKKFTDWNWRRHIDGDGKEEDILLRRKAWEGFLDFRSNRELLLYAQRHFLARRFPEYDPARKDLWEAHNRPWDFDHILAWTYLYYQGGTFKRVCDQWCYTIGNFRAWPFEDNRSDQAQKARDKLSVNGMLSEGLCNDSFIKDPQEVDGFSGGEAVRDGEVAARLFVETCRKRLLRIYQEWYESVGVTELLTTVEDASSVTTQPTTIA
jgi:hypothetical protein